MRKQKVCDEGCRDTRPICDVCFKRHTVRRCTCGAFVCRKCDEAHLCVEHLDWVRGEAAR